MAKAIAKPAISAEQKQKNKKQLRIQIKRHWMLYLFLLPASSGCLYSLCAVAGIVLAFKNYRFDLGIFGSEWAGLKHFRKFVTSAGVLDDLKNTLVNTSLKLVVCFPAPIILALLLNEVKAERIQKDRSDPELPAQLRILGRSSTADDDDLHTLRRYLQ